MATTFPSTIKPISASQRSQKPRVKRVQFGGGYFQIAGDGINNNLEKWNLTFVLDDTDKQTVEDFFLATNGYDFFNWTSQEAGATQKEYIVPEWNIQPLSSSNYQITCTFEEWPGLT